MASSVIRRRSVAVDTSGQRGLFAQPVVPDTPPDRRSRGQVQFVAPDPAQIRINEVALEEVLKQSGQRAPLKIRRWLAQLSFAEFEAVYEPGGRPSYAPRAMMGIVLSGILQGITSLRELERYARVDLGCWWISGAIMPDHSVLGRFIQRHHELLSETFFDQLTAQVLRVTRTGNAVIAADGTLIEAASSRYRLLRAQALNEAMHQARAAGKSEGDERGAKAAQAQALEVASHVLCERAEARRQGGKDPATTQIQPLEPEAVVQLQKNKKSYYASYKPSVLANAGRVILACQVHPSSETAVVPQLLQQAQIHGPIEVALMDASYFNEAVINSCAQQRIDLICPQGATHSDDWNKQSDKSYLKNRFLYEAVKDRYQCPQGEWLSVVGKSAAGGYVQYGTQACSGCSLRARCTTAKQGRRIKRYAIDDRKDALREKMKEPIVRSWYRRRQAMVEPVFSQLRHTQGLNRFRRTGLKAVRVEFALHAMAYNLGRALALTRTPFYLTILRLISALDRRGSKSSTRIASRFAPLLRPPIACTMQIGH